MILFYLVLILISFTFYILYKGILSFYLFSFLLILPVVLIIITAIQKRKLKVTFLDPHCITHKENQTPITIKIENNSIFPVANAEITLSYSMDFSDKKEKFKINSPVLAKDSQLLTFNIASNHCGTINLRITNVRISSLLKLFKPKLTMSEIKTQNEALITVFPQLMQLKNEMLDFVNGNLESNVYSKIKKGDDPSEIFDIREYAENDKLNRIHWKLTAKQGITMVKDYSLPITNMITILLNLSFNNSPENSADIYDAVVTAAYSYSSYFSEKQISHNICWYDDSKQKNISINVQNADDTKQAVCEVLTAPIHQDDCAVIHSLSHSQLVSAHWIFITSSLSDKLAELLENINEKTLITIVYVNSKPLSLNYSDKNNVKVVSVKPESLSSDLNNIIL